MEEWLGLFSSMKEQLGEEREEWLLRYGCDSVSVVLSVVWDSSGAECGVGQ